MTHYRCHVHLTSRTDPLPLTVEAESPEAAEQTVMQRASEALSDVEEVECVGEARSQEVGA